MPISIVCVCGKMHRVPDRMAGKRCRCGRCSAVFMVPGGPPAPPPEPWAPESATIRFYCRCGNIQEVPASRAGERYLCRDCGTMPLVPAESDGPADRPRQRKARLGVLALGGAAHLALASLGYLLLATDGGTRLLSRLRIAPLTVEQVVARSEASVAMISARDSLGSGFLAGPGLVATNAHVIANQSAGDIEVRFPSAPSEARGPFPARVVYRDTAIDLALLAVASRLPALELDGTPGAKRGREVVVIGCPGVGPMAIENAVSRGVMGPRVGLGSLDFDQVTVAINPGNSGGPVIDTWGRVVAVAARMAPAQQSMALCIPASEVAAAVARHRAHPDVFIAEGPARADRPPDALPRDETPREPRDPLATPPVDDPEGTPASRLAACDAGRVLAPDDPRVRRSETLLASARLLFRQDEEALARYVVDATARLRSRGGRYRASEMLAVMIECAPAPDSPAAKADAAAYASAYYRGSDGASTFADAVLAMRRGVAAMGGGPGSDNFARPTTDPRPRLQAAAPGPLTNAIEPRREPEDEPARPAFLVRLGGPGPIALASSWPVNARPVRPGRAAGGNAPKALNYVEVESGTPVKVVRSRGEGVLVRVLEGLWAGREGWVPIAFLKDEAPRPRPRGDAEARPDATKAAAKTPSRSTGPDSPSGRLEAARYLEADGRKDAAIAAYRAVIEQFPDGMEAGIAKNRLRVLRPEAKKATPSDNRVKIEPRG